MKKNYIFILICSLIASNGFAQTLVEAVRYSNEEISGTSRYRAMAGAFGALGGDPSCMNDNPAGLAIYRSTNLFSFTPHLSYTNTKAKGTFEDKEKDHNFSFSNMSGILSFVNPEKEGIINFTLGLGFERRLEDNRKYNVRFHDSQSSLANYIERLSNVYLSQSGYKFNELSNESNYNVPLLSYLGVISQLLQGDNKEKPDLSKFANSKLDFPPYQSLFVDERTRNDIYTISGALNYEDNLYAGITLSIADFNSVILSDYNEDELYYPEEDLYDGRYLYYSNDLETKGSGIGVKTGILWKPTDNWRLGFSLHTPTWYSMTDYYGGYMQTEEDQKDSGTYQFEYSFSTPWEYQFSTAYIFGTRGLISLEYDIKDFSTMRYSRSSNDHEGNYSDYNEGIKNYTKAQKSLKIGAEYRITSQLSARLGYAYISSPSSKEALQDEIEKDFKSIMYVTSTKPNYAVLDDQSYLTGGIGWRMKKWSIDISCMSHQINELISFYPSDLVKNERFKLRTNKLNWDATMSYRF